MERIKLNDEEFAAWLARKPENVQEFARQHPYKPGDIVSGFYFLGYFEDKKEGIGLMVTPLNPWESEADYYKAIEQRQFICANHFVTKGNA